MSLQPDLFFGHENQKEGYLFAWERMWGISGTMSVFVSLAIVRYSFRGKGNRRGGARYTENHPAADCTGNGPGEHGGSPDLLVAFHPEEFSKTINLLFKERGDSLDSTVVVCQPGAPIDDNAVAGFKGLVQLKPDGFDLVGNDRIMLNRNLCFGQDCLNSLPAGIRFFCSCCGYRDYCAGY